MSINLKSFDDTILALAVNVSSSNDKYSNKIPKQLKSRIDRWKFGKYGWTSPVNLLITATWVKILNPRQDVCKIWSKDGDGNSIQNSYSIRSFDEKFTVPLISRLELSNGFCSANSGMQGARSLEKSRGAIRVDRKLSIPQKTVWDINLFCEILNDINDLNNEEAKNCFSYLIYLGKKFKSKREKSIKNILNTKLSAISANSLLNFIYKVKDPEFIRLYAGLLTYHLYKINNSYLSGLNSHKTASDTKTNNPGDFWITLKEDVIIAGEVKDSNIQFSFQHLNNILKRSSSYSKLNIYLLITTNPTPVEPKILNDNDWKQKISNISELGISVVPISLSTLYHLTFNTLDAKELFLATSKLIQDMPSIKSDTISRWEEFIKKGT